VGLFWADFLILGLNWALAKNFLVNFVYKGKNIKECFIVTLQCLKLNQKVGEPNGPKYTSLFFSAERFGLTPFFG